MKKIILLLFAVLFIALPSEAVLQEKSLARTLGVLRLELQNNWKKQKTFMSRYEGTQEAQHKKLVEFMQSSEQIGLVLYSQKIDNTFDVAYACQQAIKLHQELESTNVPYDRIRFRMRDEISRYDSLIYALKHLPPSLVKKDISNLEDSLIRFVTDSISEDSLLANIEAEDENEKKDPFFLSEEEMIDREKCITYAKALRNNIVRMYNNISTDERYYKMVSTKVNRLYKYADNKYKELQDHIFERGDRNYFSILLSLKNYWKIVSLDFKEKYTPIKKSDSMYSEWRGPSLLFSSVFMIFYIIVGMLISTVIFTFLIPKKYRTDKFVESRPVWIMSTGVLIFIIAILVIRGSVDRNVIRMATGLMINIAWLIEMVLFSLLFRLNHNQIRSGVKMYTPFIVLAFFSIMCRIVLIPTSMLNLLFPPILLLCTIWQIKIGKNNRKNLPQSDKVYCGISTAVMVVSTIIAWYGYTMMSILITIWWTFQLAAIQSITCIYDTLRWYERKYILQKVKDSHSPSITNLELMRKMKNGDYISDTWVFDFMDIALIPIISVISIVLCVVWAASTFEMTSIVGTVFFTNFIDEPGVIQISLFKICLVVACYYLFKYLNYAAKSFYFLYKSSLYDKSQEFNKTFARNIIQIAIWGIYALAALVLLRVPRSGLEIISAGLASGMGFASRGLLENFFYGISLMSGRVRVGDYIECDGITGRVESITYQSTQIVTLDGSIIAFLNSALFSKNFKNLTKNHQYAMIKIPIGVAYGSDIAKVRKLLLDALQPLCTKTNDGRNIVNPEHPLSVEFSEFGDSSVNLIVIAWLLVDQKPLWILRANEIIYNTLNENNIEIPFPQRDIHIIK